ncbi:MAG: hypothetical protein RR893_06980, partial [Clostridia bacterium]
MPDRSSLLAESPIPTAPMFSPMRRAAIGIKIGALRVSDHFVSDHFGGGRSSTNRPRDLRGFAKLVERRYLSVAEISSAFVSFES